MQICMYSWQFLGNGIKVFTLSPKPCRSTYRCLYGRVPDAGYLQLDPNLGPIKLSRKQ